jgi:hypothetical protein
MGRTCSTHEAMRIAYNILSGELERKRTRRVCNIKLDLKGIWLVQYGLESTDSEFLILLFFFNIYMIWGKT